MAAALYVFAISHYCEKARWALDALGLEYELRHLAPGRHMEVAMELGAEGSSLPILELGDSVVQGSDAILDWADSERGGEPIRLGQAPDLVDAGRDLEQRLDDFLGVHVRRYYYSEALVDHPETVMPIFTRELAPAERATVEDNWGIVRKLMMAKMDLGPEQRLDSRRIVASELDWFDGLLSDGRRYLLGDRFSRADITGASLLAPLALPKEHPTYGALAVPPLAREDLDEWADRPALAWVREIYRSHR